MTHWDEDMAEATPIDLEELGVLIMSMLCGLESAKEWLGQSHVANFGLERVNDG